MKADYRVIDKGFIVTLGGCDCGSETGCEKCRDRRVKVIIPKGLNSEVFTRLLKERIDKLDESKIQL